MEQWQLINGAVVHEKKIVLQINDISFASAFVTGASSKGSTLPAGNVSMPTFKLTDPLLDFYNQGVSGEAVKQWKLISLGPPTT